MTYASQADLMPAYLEHRELVQLTNDSVGPTPTTVVLSVVVAALARADTTIDSYIGARYSLPLATTPPVLTDLACRLARYYLRGRRRGATDERDRDDHADVIRALTDISRGTITLGQQPEPGENAQRIIRSSTTERVFGRPLLEDF